MSLEEIKIQIEDSLSALGLNSNSFISTEVIEQLVITQNKNSIIILDALNVNKRAIDKKPTLVQEDMYEKENKKYVIQKGYYLIDGVKGTQTVVSRDNIVNTAIKYLAVSNKPKLKVLP